MTEESLFDLALQLPPEGRPSLLDGACKNQPELRLRIEKLLAAHAGSNLLDQPLDRISPATSAALPRQPTPQSALPTASFYRGDAEGVVVGNYTLERLLGEPSLRKPLAKTTLGKRWFAPNRCRC